MTPMPPDAWRIACARGHALMAALYSVTGRGDLRDLEILHLVERLTTLGCGWRCVA